MIPFRPHHFFCALGFQGKGYSARFTANMDAIVNGQLRRDDDTLLQVTFGVDKICAPCPKRRGARCSSQSKIEAIDAAHASALDLQDGDVLTWGEAKARMAAQPQGIHKSICAKCSWMAYGMCETAHAKLKEQFV